MLMALWPSRLPRRLLDFKVSRTFTFTAPRLGAGKVHFTCGSCHEESTSRPFSVQDNGAGFFAGALCSSCGVLQAFCDSLGNYIPWHGHQGRTS